MGRARTDAADGEIATRKVRTVRHRPRSEGLVGVLDVLDSWTIDLALLPGKERKRERVKPCKIREGSAKGNRGKPQAKSVAHVVDRDRQGWGRHGGMRVGG
jgi:hypothetical protein